MLVFRFETKGFLFLVAFIKHVVNSDLHIIQNGNVNAPCFYKACV